jgi:hypothetical protein
MLQAGYTTRSGRDRRSVTNRLRHDEAWRIAGDGIGASISRQIGCLLAQIAFSEAQRRAEKATS